MQKLVIIYKQLVIILIEEKLLDINFEKNFDIGGEIMTYDMNNLI